MSALTLNLAKPGETAPKLALNLNKGERFRVRLAWDGPNDLDLHALVCTNHGNGAKAGRDGDRLDIDEWIAIDPARLLAPVAGFLEIPLVAMIHPQQGAVRFRDVQNASVIVETEAGQPLLRAALSQEFGDFVGVQMGSILVGPGGAEFAAVGTGFNG